MTIPTLQLPSNHRYSHGDRDFYWDEEEQSWIRSPNHRSSNEIQFTRSTPASPVYLPRGNDRYNSPGSVRPFSPVSPISDNGNYPGLMDQYQQRRLLSEVDQRERVGSRRPRPRSAIALGQSQTAQGSTSVSLGAFGWI